MQKHWKIPFLATTNVFAITNAVSRMVVKRVGEALCCRREGFVCVPDGSHVKLPFGSTQPKNGSKPQPKAEGALGFLERAKRRPTRKRQRKREGQHTHTQDATHRKGGCCAGCRRAPTCRHGSETETATPIALPQKGRTHLHEAQHQATSQSCSFAP